MWTSFEFHCKMLLSRKAVSLLKGMCGFLQRRSRRGILILLKFGVGYIFHLIARLVPDSNKHMVYSFGKIILTFTSLWTAGLHYIKSNLPETASLVIIRYELTPFEFAPDEGALIRLLFISPLRLFCVVIAAFCWQLPHLKVEHCTTDAYISHSCHKSSRSTLEEDMRDLVQS